MQFKDMNLCDFCFSPVDKNNICHNCGMTHDMQQTDAGILTPGTNLLGKYIIGRTLGRGGFGATYLAFSSTLGKVVALKECLPAGIVYRGKDEQNVTLVSQDKFEFFEHGKKRFYEEAQIISRFKNCKNIVSVYEFFYANNTAYYSMEYLEGIDLKKHIARKGGRLSEDEVIRIAIEVCNALMVVHSTQTLHRDIAPDNIFICSNGDVKLIDFGTARHIMSFENPNYSVVVKQGFAPAEQYSKGGRQGTWTDIYAIGATMYYALTGAVPPDALTLADSNGIISQNLPMSYNLKCIIDRCLKFSPEERYQSVVDLMTALSGIYNGQNPEPSWNPISSGSGKKNDEQVKTKPVQNTLLNGKIYALIGAAVALFSCILVLLAVMIFDNGGGFSGSGGGGVSSGDYVESLVDPVTPEDPVSVVEEKPGEIDTDIINNIISRNLSHTEFGIYMFNKSTGYEYAYNDSDSFLASAMGQIVILDAVAGISGQYEIDNTSIRFEHMVNGKEAPDSKYESGTYVPLRKCIEDVAQYGDNNKANLLVDYIGEIYSEPNGFNIINRILRNNSYYGTSINRKIYIKTEMIDETAPPNVTTPYEIAKIFNNLVTSGKLGDEDYVKSIFGAVSGEGKPIGLNKFAPHYKVSGVNAVNSQTTNNVAIIEDSNTEILIAILTETLKRYTQDEDIEAREAVIKELTEYITQTQFEQ